MTRKKSNIIPVHTTKNSKQLVTNYQPVSLTHLLYKAFEKLFFDNIYDFINKNNLFSNN